MKKDDLLLKRISTEIRSELELISELMDEYSNFLAKYSDHMDNYLLRVKASFMADFYMGAEKIFKLIVEEINGGAPNMGTFFKRSKEVLFIS